MDRRNFLIKVPFAGIYAGGAASLFSRCSTGEADQKKTYSEKPISEKVMLAMLTMQRATWEQGVAMQALLEKGEKELLLLMAKDAVLRQSKDGRMAMLGEEFALTDAASPGEAVLWLAQETGDDNFLKAHHRLLEYLMYKAPRTEDGIIYHFTNIPQVWSDSNYMLPPFLAASGEFAEAMKQIEGVRKFLWNNEKKLFSHMWDCEKNKFARKDFWGVGNGWTAAGYARVIDMLPAGRKDDRDSLILYTQELLGGCLAYLRDDGFFHNIIDNPSSFIETNLSQQLAYTIYRGIKSGWLEQSYKTAADKMRAAALSKIDELGLIQGVCGSPEFDHAGTATEGQVFHILMEVAYSKL